MDMPLAYCGLSCGGCPIHTATLEPDEGARRRLREEIVIVCREQYGMEMTVEDVTDCDGCRGGGRLFAGCARCGIRRCAMTRGLESCAYCDDYACPTLEQHLQGDPEARPRLEALRMQAGLG